MDVVRQASFLVPNEFELAILTDMPVESEAEIRRSEKPGEAGRRNNDRDARRARFAAGDTGGSQRVAPVKVQAVDTTGAGDAFIGSFARYLAGGLALEAAITEATCYSAFSVSVMARRNHMRPRRSSRRSPSCKTPRDN